MTPTNIRPLMTSDRQDWKTPKSLYETLDKEFLFDFDPCPVNPTFDGLSSAWRTCNFVNPPFGREIVKWVRKAWDEYIKGSIVVLLIPARTDTTYWHEYVMQASEIRFIKRRLHYDDDLEGRAPFPSAIIIFDPLHRRSSPIIKSVDVKGDPL